MNFSNALYELIYFSQAYIIKYVFIEHLHRFKYVSLRYFNSEQDVIEVSFNFSNKDVTRFYKDSS